MNSYFFIDGASLLADIRRARKELELPPGRFLPFALVRYFASYDFEHLHGGAFRQVVFYFVRKDGLEKHLVLPDLTKKTGYMEEDVRFEYCGKLNSDARPANEWLINSNAPQYVTDWFQKSEKAVDTQICCDALQLAATNKIDRLFLYTNDFDFAPLCTALHRLGVNINLFRLREKDVNSDLVYLCDGYHCPTEQQFKDFFERTPLLPPIEGAPKATA